MQIATRAARTLCVTTTALALTLALAAPAHAGGRVHLDLDATGVATGGGLAIAFTCLATGESDGTSYPDPHVVRVSCALTNDAGDVWPAADEESRAVPAAVTYGRAIVPFSKVPGLKLCGVAEGDFSDGSTESVAACSTATSLETEPRG